MKKIVIAILILGAITLSACNREADTASYNLSAAADAFEVDRRVVFMNGITDTYMLSIEGRCSIKADTEDGQLEVTCKIGSDPDVYKKHFLGLSDNVTYFVEQLEPVEAGKYHYRVFFRPQTIIPDVDVEVG